MRIAPCVLVSLSGALLLAGCDVIGKIPLTPAEAIKAADRFGLPTRELVEATPEGKVYRLMVESRRSASWLQADYAMWKQLSHSCPDGEPHVTLSAEPTTDDSHEDIARPHPADTLFVRIVRCAPKPPFEFEFERRLPYSEAYGFMVRRVFDAASSGDGLVVLPIQSGGPLPKYHKVNTMLGTFVLNKSAGCPAGVRVTHLQLGMFPSTDEATDQDEAAGYLGAIVDCIAGPATAPLSVPDAGA